MLQALHNKSMKIRITYCNWSPGQKRELLSQKYKLHKILEIKTNQYTVIFATADSHGFLLLPCSFMEDLIVLTIQRRLIKCPVMTFKNAFPHVNDFKVQLMILRWQTTQPFEQSNISHAAGRLTTSSCF